MRTRTDETLQGGNAFNLVVENQRYFAICQDKYANLAKKQREVIAYNSVQEVNELIRVRKNLQIEAFRLTEMFKTKVNSMAQKEVEDIFSKTMAKSQFKASTTLKLAKTLMHKHKDKPGFPKFEADSMQADMMQASKQPTKITEEPGSNAGSREEQSPQN